MIRALGWVLRRDLLLAFRRRGDVVNALVFFVIVVSLFPLGVGPETAQLRSMAPGVLWVAALLACMLSLARLFAPDHQDGTLEQMLLAGEPLVVLVIGKVLAHWLVSGLPLVLIAPLLGVQFGLSGDALVVLSVSLLIGTPVLSLIGAVGAALTLGVRGSGVLVALLVLPLYVPGWCSGRVRSSPRVRDSPPRPTCHRRCARAGRRARPGPQPWRCAYRLTRFRASLCQAKAMCDRHHLRSPQSGRLPEPEPPRKRVMRPRPGTRQALSQFRRAKI